MVRILLRVDKFKKDKRTVFVVADRSVCSEENQMMMTKIHILAYYGIKKYKMHIWNSTFLPT